MTRASQKLDLEHSGGLWLDIRQLGVIADTLSGRFLSSNRQRRELCRLSRSRLSRAPPLVQPERSPRAGVPIVRSAIAGQLPAEQDRDGDVSILPNADREAVYKLSKLIFGVAEELSLYFQLIITDHADLRDQWFADAVVALWRGEGSVP